MLNQISTYNIVIGVQILAIMLLIQLIFQHMIIKITEKVWLGFMIGSCNQYFLAFGLFGFHSDSRKHHDGKTFVITYVTFYLFFQHYTVYVKRFIEAKNEPA